MQDTKEDLDKRRAIATRMDLAACVSDRVDIEDICLVETYCARNPLYKKEVISDVDIQPDMRVKTVLSDDKSHIDVYPRFIIEARVPDKPETESLFLRIESRFRLVYKIKSCEGLTEEHFDAFGQLNGIYNAWPFWREYVQSMTTRMGLPALTIKVYRLPMVDVSDDDPIVEHPPSRPPHRKPMSSKK